MPSSLSLIGSGAGVLGLLLVLVLVVLNTELVGIGLELRILLAKAHQSGCGFPLSIGLVCLVGGIHPNLIEFVILLGSSRKLALGAIDLSLRISNDALLSINHLA